MARQRHGSIGLGRRHCRTTPAEGTEAVIESNFLVQMELIWLNPDIEREQEVQRKVGCCRCQAGGSGPGTAKQRQLAPVYRPCWLGSRCGRCDFARVAVDDPGLHDHPTSLGPRFEKARDELEPFRQIVAGRGDCRAGHQADQRADHQDEIGSKVDASPHPDRCGRYWARGSGNASARRVATPPCHRVPDLRPNDRRRWRTTCPSSVLTYTDDPGGRPLGQAQPIAARVGLAARARSDRIGADALQAQGRNS